MDNIKLKIDNIKKLFTENTDDGKGTKYLIESERKTLKRLGLIRKYDLKPYHYLVFFHYHLLSIGCLGHLIYYIHNYKFNFFDIADDVAVLVSVTAQSLVHFQFAARARLFEELLDNIGDFTTYQKPKQLERLNNIFNFASYTTNSFLTFSYVMLCITILTEKCDEHSPMDCGLAFTSYLPFVNINTMPFRPIYGFLQITTGILNIATGINMVLLGTFISEALIAYIDEFLLIITMLTKISSRSERKRHIKNVVQYHNRIYELNAMYRKATSLLYLILITSSMIVTSLTAYELLGKGYTYPALLHFTAYFGACFLACYFGQRLINESEKISDVIHDIIPWDGDTQTQKDLLFIDKRSQMVLSTTCGGFAKLQYSLFIQIVKASYSYLTLMLETDDLGV